MIAFTVIDGKVRKMDCFANDCLNSMEALLIQDFINQFSRELSIKDLYFIIYNRDSIHYEAARLSVEGYEYNKTLH